MRTRTFPQLHQVTLDGKASGLTLLSELTKKPAVKAPWIFRSFWMASLLPTAGLFKGSDAPKQIPQFFTRRRQKIEFIVKKGSQNIDYAHADWGSALFYFGRRPKRTA